MKSRAEVVKEEIAAEEGKILLSTGKIKLLKKELNQIEGKEPKHEDATKEDLAKAEEEFKLIEKNIKELDSKAKLTVEHATKKLSEAEGALAVVWARLGGRAVVEERASLARMLEDLRVEGDGLAEALGDCAEDCATGDCEDRVFAEIFCLLQFPSK